VLERYRFSKLVGWGVEAPRPTARAVAAAAGGSAGCTGDKGGTMSGERRGERVFLLVLPDGGQHTLGGGGGGSGADDGRVRATQVWFRLDGRTPGNSGAELCELLSDYARWLAARHVRRG
jgi:hypothetical protein